MRTDVNTCDCTRGCTDTVRKSALKADSWGQIPCRTGKSNLRQRRANYQLSHNATTASSQHVALLTMPVSSEKPRAIQSSPATFWALMVKVIRSVLRSYTQEKSIPQTLAAHEPCVQLSPPSVAASAAQRNKNQQSVFGVVFLQSQSPHSGSRGSLLDVASD